jgi:hypothetical protein
MLLGTDEVPPTDLPYSFEAALEQLVRICQMRSPKGKSSGEYRLGPNNDPSR